MMLITKELALAVIKSHTFVGGVASICEIEACSHCGAEIDYQDNEIQHDSTCIVVRAKLLLKYEWGIEA